MGLLRPLDAAASDPHKYPWPGSEPEPTYPRGKYAAGMNEPSGPRDNWTVGVGAGVFLVLAVALASQVAPPSRLRRFSIREAVLALCGVTVASSVLGIVGGSYLGCICLEWHLIV